MEQIPLTVYNNGANKVLMSSNGKIARMPYQFRNAFMNKAGLGNYIRVQLPNVTQYGQFMQWVYYPVLGNNSGVIAAFCNLKNTNNDNFRMSLWEFGGNGTWGYGKNFTTANHGNIFVGSTVTNQRLISAIVRSNSTGFLRFNTSIVNNNAIAQSNGFAINEVLIGAVRSANGLTISNTATSTTRLGEFVLFERELTAAEYWHYYSNKNGNWLQSIVDYRCRLYCDKAEILDFSALQDGSDMRVGCRDYSGYNHHGEIMLLPAGTLKFKMDFANDNLFDKFIPVT